MKRKTTAFCFAAISTLVLISLFGVTSAKPVADVTVTYATTWNPVLIPSPTGGQVQVVLNNTGGIPIAKFTLGVSGGTVTYFYDDPNWPKVASGNTSATWQAKSGKWVLGKYDYHVFDFTWTGDYSTGFSGAWTAYDRKGNVADSGSFSWHYP